MKQFCFLNEDDLDNLPKDVKLIPFDVAVLENRISEKPKTLTTEMSEQEYTPSTTVMLGLNSQVESG